MSDHIFAIDDLRDANKTIQREVERLRSVMKAVASMPGRQWLIGQLALAEALGEGGEHLDYVLSINTELMIDSQV